MNVLEGLITIIQQKKKMLSKVNSGSSGSNGDNTPKATVRMYWDFINTYLYACRLYIDDELIYCDYVKGGFYQGEEIAITPPVNVSIETYNKLYDALSNDSCKFYFNDGDGENAGIKIIDGEIRFGETQGNYLYIQGTIIASDNPPVIIDKHKFLYIYNHRGYTFCSYLKDNNTLYTVRTEENDAYYGILYIPLGLDLVNVIGEEIINGEITTININMKSYNVISAYGEDGSTNYYFKVETPNGTFGENVSILYFT